jgi:hypothetical protein
MRDLESRALEIFESEPTYEERRQKVLQNGRLADHTAWQQVSKCDWRHDYHKPD